MTYKYALDGVTIQKDNGDGSFTYFRNEKTDGQVWEEFEEWLAEGNEPLPADQPE